MGEIVKLAVVGEAAAAARAASVLKTGRVVILPTDTVYGLTAVAFRRTDMVQWVESFEPDLWREPVAELYRIKGRVETQPALILARDWYAAANLAKGADEDVTAFCREETTPITVILPAKRPWGPPAVNDSGGVAIRIPEAGWIREVLVLIPYLFSVSANEPGGPQPTWLDAIPAAMLRTAALAVDAGPASAPQPSSLVDFTVRPPRVKRGDDELRARLRFRFKS